MDPSAFKGLSFYPIFLLASDSQDEYDGFYLDDLRVVYQDSVVGTQVILPLSDFRLRQNQPNPAGDQTRISWENELQLNGAATLVVFNLLGGKVLEQAVQLGTENSLLLNTKTWPAGLYTYLLQTPAGQTEAYKMTVLHR